MQVPGTGDVVFQDQYGTSSDPLLWTKTMRTAALFRAKGFDQPGGPTVELLYGDSKLWKYAPEGADPTTQPAQWTQVPNNMGEPKFGQAGFDNQWNSYIWSMAVQNNRLYVGTFDYATLAAGDVYVAAKGNVDAVEAYAATVLGYPNVRMGADLWAIPAGGAQPFAVSKEGIGNPLNHGVRNMVATSAGLFCGTASSSNLLTDPYNPPTQPLQAGGWELVKITVTPAAKVKSASTKAAASAVRATGAAIVSAVRSAPTGLDLAALTEIALQTTARKPAAAARDAFFAAQAVMP
jgi:hypothetical protein